MIHKYEIACYLAMKGANRINKDFDILQGISTGKSILIFCDTEKEQKEKIKDIVCTLYKHGIKICFGIDFIRYEKCTIKFLVLSKDNWHGLKPDMFYISED